MLAVIEFSASHDECLWSWKALAEANNKEVIYFVHPQIAKRTPFILPNCKVIALQLPEKTLERFRFLIQLKKQLKALGIRKVLFNTATGSLVRDFLLISGKSFSYTGVLHDGEKLKGSLSQATISRWIKHYIVLSDHIKQNIAKFSSLKTEAIYPIYFPSTLTSIPKNSTGFRVVIPGQLELARRDYPTLINALKGHSLPSDFKLIFLGKSKHVQGSRAEVDAMLNEAGISAHAQLFDEFVDDQTFYSELRQADVILPLVHPGAGHYDSYFRYQVTGSWNLAFGFQVPLLMHRSFEGYPIFRETSLFYSREELANRLLDLYHQRWRLENTIERIKSCSAFDLSEQEVKFKAITRL